MNRFTVRLAPRAAILLVLALVIGFGSTVESSSSRRSDLKNPKRKPSATLKHSAAPVAASPMFVTLTVDTTSDNAALSACTPAANDCSLRGAIIAANATSGTIISLAAGTYSLTIAGAGEQLAATGDLDVRGNNTSIVGAGAGTTIIQQTTNDRVLDVNPTNAASFNFDISGVTITGGSLASSSGTGMLCGGAGSVVTVTNCVFTGNTNTGVFLANGGAIAYVGNAGSMTVLGSTFSNNTIATGVGAGIRYSGSGSLTVENSSFTNNQNTTNTGAGINATGGGTYIVRRSSFTNNRALGATSRGGAIAIGTGNLTVEFSRLVGNISGSGAAEEVNNSTGTATVQNNWWGVNTGPSGSDVSGATASVWLQLRHSASPNTLCSGATATLTADILGLNAGGSTGASNLVGLPAFPATFNNAVNGSISGASANFVDGIATATFTAGGSPGAASADATADQQTITASLTVDATTATDPSDQTVCQGANANFSTSTTGSVNSIAWTVDGSPAGNTASITVPTGSLSPGNHTVVVTVTGACNTVTQTATLTVNASTATTDPADVSVCQGAMANFSTTASGTGPFSYAWLLDGSPFNGNSPSISIDTSSLSPGNHSVQVTTTGACGSAVQTATLTINNTPPVITLSQTNIVVWPPNHQYQTFNVSDFVASASSTCDPNVDASDVYIVSVSSDESDNSTGADGNTINDIVIAPDCKSVQLRAERDGDLDGRVYTITFKVTDANGNSTTVTATVKVPLNINGNAVNSGVNHTVNSACP